MDQAQYMTGPEQYEDDSMALAIRKVLTHQEEYARQVHGRDSREWRQVETTAVLLGKELFGPKFTPERTQFMRWLMGMEES